MSINLYRSNPTIVEAIQWNGTNGEECSAFAPDKVRATASDSIDPLLTLLAGKDGAQEWVPVPVGHWLVSPPDDRTDIWPVEDKYFRNKYELHSTHSRKYKQISPQAREIVDSISNTLIHNVGAYRGSDTDAITDAITVLENIGDINLER